MRRVAALWLVVSVGWVACGVDQGPDALPVPDLELHVDAALDTVTADVSSAPDLGASDLSVDLGLDLPQWDEADGVGGECLDFNDCDDDNPCTFDFCDALSRCVHKAIEGPCDDGNPCTLGDLCQQGECQPETILECDDDNPCTKDICKDDGCYHGNLEGPCDDGDPCTLGDYCKVGTCQGGVGKRVCDDSNSCTSNGCQPFVGCRFEPVGGLCDDGDPCTQEDQCQEGECLGKPLSCDDDNPCTDDHCVGGQCNHQPTPPAACDDLNPCTEQDTCDGDGSCVGESKDCDDGSICTQDSCDPTSGDCLHLAVPGPCEDGSLCTTDDLCVAGLCVGTPMDCDDDNLCTADQCLDETGECAHEPLTGSCDDHNLCTVGDTCMDGACVPGGEFPDCQDGNPCTGDTCDPKVGCVNDVLWGWPCDDGDGCTSNDLCTLAALCVGESTVCDDQDPCTADSCDPDAGACLFLPAPGAGCDDGNICTKKDTCQADGTCQGEAKSCDDLNPCTVDSCQAGFGCVNTPVEPCNG